MVKKLIWFYSILRLLYLIVGVICFFYPALYGRLLDFLKRNDLSGFHDFSIILATSPYKVRLLQVIVLCVVILVRLFQAPLILFYAIFFTIKIVNFRFSVDYTDKTLPSWYTKNPWLTGWGDFLVIILLKRSGQVGFFIAYKLTQRIFSTTAPRVFLIVKPFLVWAVFGISHTNINISARVAESLEDFFSRYSYSIWLKTLPQHVWTVLFGDFGELGHAVSELRVYKIRNVIYFNPDEKVRFGCTVVSYIAKGRVVEHPGTDFNGNSNGLQAAIGFTGRPLQHMECLEVAVDNYRQSTCFAPINLIQSFDNIKGFYRHNPRILKNFGLDNNLAYSHFKERIYCARLLQTDKGVYYESHAKENDIHFPNKNIVFDIDIIEKEIHAVTREKLSTNLQKELDFLANSFLKLNIKEQELLLTEIANKQKTIIDLKNLKYTEISSEWAYLRNKLGFDEAPFKGIIDSDTN